MHPCAQSLTILLVYIAHFCWCGRQRTCAARHFALPLYHACPLSGMHGWCKSFVIKLRPFPPPTHQQALGCSSMASAAAGEGPGRHGSHGHNGRGVDGGSFPVRVFVGTALSGDGDGGDKDASHVVVATNSGERSLCYQYTISFACGRFILNVKSSNTAHFYCEPNNSVS